MFNASAGKALDSGDKRSWPRGSTEPGFALVGIVGAYVERESTRRKGEKFTTMRIDKPVEAEPHKDGSVTLTKYDEERRVIVGAWLANLVDSKKVPVGTVVQITYTGTLPGENRTKTFTVRIVDKDYLKSLHGVAVVGEKSETTEGGDDLPF